MEHIVQFGVNIDDEVIKKTILANAERTVINEVKEELGLSYGYFKTKENMLKKLVDDEVQRQFDLLKEDIIKATATKLADKLIRTKAAKTLKDSMGETNGR